MLGVKNTIETRTSREFNEIDGRCENLAGLAVALERLLLDNRLSNEKFVIVFDGIDKLRDSHGQPTLFPGLVRLGEIVSRTSPYYDIHPDVLQIRNLTIVLIMTSPLPRSLHRPGLPHIHFTPYDRASALKILSMAPMNIYTSAQVEKMDEQQQLAADEDDAWLWGKYVGVIWDSLGKTAARDIVSLKNLCKKLWVPFVSHIRDGTYGPRDFAKLVVRTREIFRDESVLIDNLTISYPSSESKEGNEMKKKNVKGLPKNRQCFCFLTIC